MDKSLNNIEKQLCKFMKEDFELVARTQMLATHSYPHG